MRKQRTPQAIAAVAIVIAAINFFGVAQSPRWAEMRTVDVMRLTAAGMLIGVALMIVISSLRRRAN